MRWRNLAAAFTLVATFSVSAPARAGYLDDAGWGALTAVANLGYMPAKLVYSMMGGLTGGLAYAATAGDLETAQNVWTTSMGGTYVLTPRMMQGHDPIAFAYYPAARPTTATAAATTSDDSGWSAAEMPGDSIEGSELGSSGRPLDEQPAGGF
jgi:hypothetical protein